jgi:hypothetical protein
VNHTSPIQGIPYDSVAKQNALGIFINLDDS